jgi:hypothetical protein
MVKWKVGERESKVEAGSQGGVKMYYMPEVAVACREHGLAPAYPLCRDLACPEPELITHNGQRLSSTLSVPMRKE